MCPLLCLGEQHGWTGLVISDPRYSRLVNESVGDLA